MYSRGSAQRNPAQRFTNGIKAYSEEAGLKIDWNVPSGVFPKLAYITQIPKEFDFENPLLPPQFHYTGPFHDGKGRPKMDFPWDRLTGEPLIYASMGTLMNGAVNKSRNHVRAVAQKLRDSPLSDCQEATEAWVGQEVVFIVG